MVKVRPVYLKRQNSGMTTSVTSTEFHAQDGNASAIVVSIVSIQMKATVLL